MAAFFGIVTIVLLLILCGWHIVDAIKFVYGGNDDDFS